LPSGENTALDSLNFVWRNRRGAVAGGRELTFAAGVTSGTGRAQRSRPLAESRSMNNSHLPSFDTAVGACEFGLA
jgi:hypothetical protein